MKIAFAAVAAFTLLAANANAAAGGSGWDGRWAGAWGGRDATAVIVKGGRVVAYEYGGGAHPVEHSKTSGGKIVYGEADIVVTLTRTGANTAHATIHTGQGDGQAELTRK